MTDLRLLFTSDDEAELFKLRFLAFNTMLIQRYQIGPAHYLGDNILAPVLEPSIVILPILDQWVNVNTERGSA